VSGNRRTQDHFGKRARREHYPARSIYKLEEIDRKTRLLRPGQVVLDLGASPGSWTLYVASKVGPSGRVVAIDRVPLTIGLAPNVVYVQADALAIDPALLKTTVGVDGFHAVISDMAPRTTGQRFVDQARSFRLFERAVEIGTALLLPGGGFVGKIFQGEDFQAARALLTARFEKTRIIRPASVRSESYETYLVGLSYR